LSGLTRHPRRVAHSAEAYAYPCRSCRHVFDAALSRKELGARRIEKYLKMSKKLIFKING